MKTEREVWVVTDKHGSYYATTEEEARNMATPGDEVTRYIPATPSPAGQSEAQKWLESELDWYTARVLPGAVGQCDATVIRGLLRAAMDVTHEAGTPEGTRAAVMDTVTQSAHVLYGCLGEAGYLQRYESQSEQSPAGQTCPDCAEHCHDFQAIASALGILDELPDTPRVLERAAELLAARSEQSPAWLAAPGTIAHPETLAEAWDDGYKVGKCDGECDARGYARSIGDKNPHRVGPALGPAEPVPAPLVCNQCRREMWSTEEVAAVEREAKALHARLNPTAEPVERSGWKPVLDSKGAVRCDEGETYLFAIQVSTNGAPAHWEYFSDAIIWDSESDPQWSDGNCGWEIGDDGLYFRPLPAPPAVDAKGGKL